VPGAAATGTFNANTANDPNLTAAATVGKLLFSIGSDAEIFTGSALTLNGVSAIGIDNQSGVTQTFNNTLIAAAAQSWNAGSGNLAFSAVTLTNNLTLTGSSNLTFSGTLLNSGGNRSFINNSTGTVSVGAVNLSNNNTARTLTFSGAGNTSVTGVIGNGGTGAGGVTKTGTGTLTLSGTNTYTGATTINAGTLSVATIGNGGVAGNLGAATTTATNLVLGGGTLEYTGATASTNRNFVLTAGTTSTISVTNGASNLTISGASTNTTGALTKGGAGTLTLSGANLYTGATTVSAGTLMLGASNVLSNSTAVTVAVGATLDVNGQTETIASLAGAGTVDFGTGTLISAGNASTIFSGAFTGPGTFTKQGTGILTLDTDLTFNGTFNLAGGTLRLTDMTLNLDTLNITGNSTIDFAGASASLYTTNLNLNGFTLTITNWSNALDFFYATNWTGAVVNTRGAAPMNQVTFNGFTAANTQWQGYDNQVTPVPEPSAYGALLLGTLTALFAWRRRA